MTYLRWTLQYELRRAWENRVVWWVLRLIPRELKRWVVVQAAVKTKHGGSPDEITYSMMAKALQR